MQFVIKQLGFSIITTYIINFTKRKSSDLYISKHSLWPKTFFMRKYSLGYNNAKFSLDETHVENHYFKKSFSFSFYKSDNLHSGAEEII